MDSILAALLFGGDGGGSGGGGDLPRTSALLKGDGEGGAVAAVAGTDYVAPEAGKGLFSGSYDDLDNLPTIPSTLAELTGDPTYRTVTDEQIGAWNIKSDSTVNLLDNADWGYALVNQRGNAAYNVTSGAWDSTIGGDYTIDRWITHGNITIVNPTDSGVGYITMSAGTIMKQRFEIVPSSLFAKTVAIAVEVDGVYYGASVQFPGAASGESVVAALGDSGISVSVGFDSGTYTLCDVPDVSGVPYIKITASETVNVSRVFAELGTVSHAGTTAPRAYGEILSQCNRYYFAIGTYYTAFGFISNQAKSYFMFVPVPAPLRTVPSVSLSGWRGRKAATTGYLSYTGNVYKAPTSIAVAYSPRSTMVRISDTITSGSDENNQIAQYEFESLALSAEL